MKISDKIIHVTIHIKTLDEAGLESTGTGFFFRFSYDDHEKSVPVIVTNKHVIDGAKKGVLRFRIADENGNPRIGDFVDIHVNDFEQRCIRHPDSEVDLAILPVGPFFHHIEAQGKRPFFPGLEKNLIPSEQEEKSLSAIENIIMIGYPTAIWDQKNNIPIVRRGITATSFGVDFEGRREFLIDCACFPGSSGSPIFILDEGVHMYEKDKIGYGTRFHFLGILWGGPQFSSHGDLVAVPVPTSNRIVSISNIPMNLGFCIKSQLLLDFENLF
ncbi:S1 family peptidase [Bombella mellum]|uniref:Serine protease n=1 Tax=Bombella mellum TaxID=2039288 RepID=A0ABR5ZTM5_9PROT|nr:serine protease [Bombella mellum]MBA5727539.1 serine protease [Bombella mellum]